MTNRTSPLLLPLLLLTLCIPYSSSFSILGTWRLTLDSSFPNISPSETIVFEFKKQITSTTPTAPTITNVLSVYACQVVEFGYAVVDSRVDFMVRKMGAMRRKCDRDQIGDIVGKMEKVAYTSTIGNTLMFMSASGSILVRLTKIQPPKTPTISGAWQVTKILSQPTSILVKSNSSQVQFCNGLAQIDYRIPQPFSIQFRIKETKGCQEYDLLTNVYRSTYVRGFGDEVLLYNRDGELLMRWRNLGELGGRDPIVWMGGVVKIKNENETGGVTASANASGNVNGSGNTNLNINESKVEDKKSTTSGGVTNSKIDGDVIGAPTSGNNSPAPTVTLTTTITSIPPPNSQPQLPQTLPVLPTLQPQPPATAPAPAPAPSGTPPYLQPLKKQQIFTKWYLIGSVTQTMAVITANRIMVYGDCGVWFSIINVREGVDGKVEVFNNQAKNSLPACLGKAGGNGTGMEGVIGNVRYFRVWDNGKNQRFLSFWDKNDNKIAEWASFKQK